MWSWPRLWPCRGSGQGLDVAIELAEPAADRRYAVRADPPELSQQHRYIGAAPNPRTLTGRFGASSHVLRFPSGLSSGFPFAQLGSSPSSAFFRFPFVWRSPVPSLRPSLSGSVPLRFPSGFPFLFSNLYASPPRAPVLQALVPCGQDQGHQYRHDPGRRRRRSARNTNAPRERIGAAHRDGPTGQRTITCA